MYNDDYKYNVSSPNVIKTSKFMDLLIINIVIYMYVIVKPHLASLQCSLFCTRMSNKGRDACPWQVQYIFNIFIGYLSAANIETSKPAKLISIC